MNYGTWNVQGIRGKMEEITSELGKLKMDVIGLTETKRKGIGTEIVRDYVHLYSGVSKDRRAERGVSILIHKKFKKGITNWGAVNENMTVNINHLGNKMTVILISNFSRVLNIVCFLLGDSPASEIYMPTFRNTLSFPSS